MPRHYLPGHMAVVPNSQDLSVRTGGGTQTLKASARSDHILRNQEFLPFGAPPGAWIAGLITTKNVTQQMSHRTPKQIYDRIREREVALKLLPHCELKERMQIDLARLRGYAQSLSAGEMALRSATKTQRVKKPEAKRRPKPFSGPNPR